MPYDESLAFTVLVESDPTYRGLTHEQAVQRRNDLLGAWWRQESQPHFWKFAQSWLEDHQPLMCEAHRDDCPLGPDPHPFVDPLTTEAWQLCCCRQPWEPPGRNVP
jgi:hypothetical protein